MATLELSIGEGSPSRRSGGRAGSGRCSGGDRLDDLRFCRGALANLLPLPSPTDMDMLEPPGVDVAQHWLGTDGPRTGRTGPAIYGARISLIVALWRR